MNQNKPPQIDPRRFEDIERMVKGLVPHYTPEWRAASENDPGVALIKIFTHMSESIINHLNQVPQKNFIAFLDMLGIKQLPAQSSRVPVTFMLAKGMDKEILIPERTQVSSDKTEEHEELLFEIEENLTATPSQLIDVYGIDPINDRIYKPPQDFLDIEKNTQSSMTYTIVSLASKGTKAFQLDHVTDLKEKDILKIADTEKIEYVEISGITATIVKTKDKLEFDHSPNTKVEKITKFNLFEGKNLQDHILYIANKDLFNIKGKAQFSLYVTHHPGTETGVTSLDYSWQYWGKIKKNGSEEEVEDWQEFDEIIDGTHGFTMDGEIKLIKLKGGEITEKEIKLAEGGEDEGIIKSRWIRCKLKEPLGNKVARKLPKLDNIVFTVESKGKDLVPDLAFNNDIPLDISKPFMPFGKEPRIFDIFAIGSKEIFSKKGGTIKMNIKLDPGGSLGPPTAVLFDEYLFRWNEVPGEDEHRLKEILLQKYCIDWVKKANIEKTQDEKTITLKSTENNTLSLSISLNDEKTEATKAILTLDDGRTDEFVVKKENGNPAIYDKKIRIFLRGFFGKLIEIKTNPDDPDKKSEWIDHGFPPNTTIFARSAPSAVVYLPLNSSTAVQEREKFSIFLRGENGHLIERLFDTKKIQWEWIDWQSPRQYLFNWNKIPGGDNLKLIEYLRLNFGFDPAKIKKIENVDDCTKKIYTDRNSILLKLDIEKSKVVLNFDDGRTDEFNAKMENGKLNIYSQKNNVDINSDPASISSIELSVFVIASDNYLYEFNKKKGEWKCHPHENNQTFDSSPFVVTYKTIDINIVRVFLKGKDGQLYQLKCKMGDDSVNHHLWIGVEPLPIGIKVDSKPFAWVSDDACSILAYIKGDDNQLWEYDSTAESNWNVRKNDKGIIFDSDPYGYIYAIKPEQGGIQKNIHIFLKGMDNSLYEYNNEKNWDTDHQMPVKLTNSPFVLNENINKLFIFSDTSQNRILERISPLYLPGPSWIDHKDPYEQILNPSLSWEYLTDKGWVAFKEIKDETSNLLAEGKIKLKVPDDIVESKIAGQENYWIRARLIGGNYGEEIFIPTKNIASFIKTTIKPPIFDKIIIDYSFEEKKEPEKCITYNNLGYLDQTEASKIPDKFFEPFVQLDEEFPSIYLGFDKILKSGPLRIFFAAKGLPFTEDNKPIMRWSYSKDTDWDELKGYSDNTEGLIKSGILEFAGPSDFSARTISSKYLFWIKGSLIRGKYEEEYPLLSGIFPNTTFAVQAETIREEILGSSDGRPDQIFSFLRVPILEGEEIRVQEVLTDQEKQDLIDKFEVKDETGKIIETWVLWSEVQNFFDSNKKDRHYTLDRATGKIKFGNGINGLIPAMGENNVKAFLYQTGGGAGGNIEDREIKSLKSAISGIDKVLNPEAADGGAKAATLDQMLEIGPAMISHRNRAVTPQDFEWLAKKASRKIVKVKCLSNTNNQTNTKKEHLKEKGWVTVIIVPDEKIPKPVPSLELRRIVKKYLEDHCANILSSPGHVWVDGPAYIEISVSVDVFVTSIDLVSVVERGVKRKLDEFFHPLTGGPEGKGWDFGRDVNVSDIYALLGEIDGLDHIENLILDYDVPGKEFLFCWNEMPENNSRLLDYLIKTFDARWVKTANIVNSDELKANLFSWDEFLEEDNRLIDFLIQNFNEDWVKVAKIKRYSENHEEVARYSEDHEEVMMIMLSDGENCISLKLDHKKTKMKVIINKIENDKLIAKRIEEFITRKENSKNIIKIRTIKISDGENSIFLRLNNNETKVDLIINDGRTDEFIVKNENGRLNIYSQDVIEIKPDFLVANGKHTINTQFEKRE